MAGHDPRRWPRAATPTGLLARIDADRRLTGLPPVTCYGEVDSTNDIALRLLADGAPDGTAVLADAQHAGRGRQRRTWFSPPGAGIYLSLVTRPPVRALSLVTLAAGVAVARAVASATALPVALKWPNDVVIGRPWRKLAGVLCEASGSPGGVEGVVIGVGVNVRAAAYPPDLLGRATALEVELGREVEGEAVVVELLAELVAVRQTLGTHDLAAIRDAWRGFARPGLGAPVTWHAEGGPRRGVARDIADDGALIVQTPEGVERLTAGEVTWERLT